MSLGNRAASLQLPLPGIPQLTEGEFKRFQQLIQDEIGIYLGPVKKDLLVARLCRRLRELGLTSFSAYYERVANGGDPAERQLMLDCICTNETHFFREPSHFNFLEQRVLPGLLAQPHRPRSRSIRVWSAGCSTGEEPYSIAMAFKSRLSAAQGWQLDVLGTDISTRVLRAAEAAIWPLEKAREIPVEYLNSFVLRSGNRPEDKITVSPEIRAAVRFARLNLNADAYPGIGRFDFIFCRNVLIYFQPKTRDEVIARLFRHLLPGGYLFLGHSESLIGVTDRARSVWPTVYMHAEPEDSVR